MCSVKVSKTGALCVNRADVESERGKLTEQTESSHRQPECVHPDTDHGSEQLTDTAHSLHLCERDMGRKWDANHLVPGNKCQSLNVCDA